MHFLIFKDTVPYEIHKWNNVDESLREFKVYTPPQRNNPYRWEGENILGILIPCDKKEDLYKDVEGEFTLLDLLFSRNEANYASTIRKLYRIFPKKPIVITDYGYRNQNSIVMTAIGAKPFGVIHYNSDNNAYINCFHMVLNNLEKLNPETTYLELLKKTIDTGVLGEWYTVSIPKWYNEALINYGSSDENVVNKYREKYRD